jgi:multiple sugar transport system substrate-binding protein
MMIKLFEARNPGIKIKYEPVPNMLEKVRAAIAAEELPDFIYIDENAALEILDYLKPMPEWVMTEDEIRTRFGDFIADFYKAGGFEGKYYILPYGVMAGGILYYNKDKLEAAGYTKEDIPKTWPEFIEMAKELTVYDEAGNVVEPGFAILGQDMYLWDSVLFQKGGCRFVNSKTIGWNSPEGYEAAKFVMDLFNVHKVDSLVGAPAMEAFGTGKAAFAYVWSWYIGFLGRKYPLVKFGTATLPTFTGEPPYGRLSYNLGFAVTATDPAREEAAWKFLDFLMSDEFIKGWSPLRGSTPTSLELAKLDLYKTDEWAGVMKALEPGNSRTEGPWPEEVQAVIVAMWEAIREGAPIEETMDDAAVRATEILAGTDHWLLIGKEGFEEIFGIEW